ncbi:hypothetical protein SARC_11841 [Sphaeroforma arctica JP610]|uniref:Uncharacterized protein n=1 Tax=Sphaeroforma arctica JP610 TaxID=667725 RepID=A0A0L0FFU5_9EUKA|nr:hypothetical protein SARC_11841 [Sphaeroforma arctica JP610]KNC75639.1 hypothetical protein SARC_11841 [Sphaeroforma arctica JP610]|eukprot:XP_014149541.1 hypothetical protein SARC_11841 [Sphaeroforma arctica JP610]
MPVRLFANTPSLIQVEANANPLTCIAPIPVTASYTGNCPWFFQACADLPLCNDEEVAALTVHTEELDLSLEMHNILSGWRWRSFQVPLTAPHTQKYSTLFKYNYTISFAESQ